MRNIKQIVQSYLIRNNFDGLFYPGDCSCKIGNLMPCGNPNELECQAGHLIPEFNEDGERNYSMKFDFCIGEKEL